MHAASVYPEPGSNSLNIVYTRRSLEHRTYQSLPAPNYFRAAFSKFKFQKNFSEPLCFVVVQFSRNLRSPLSGELVNYSISVSACQYLFQKFFRVFYILSLELFHILSAKKFSKKRLTNSMFGGRIHEVCG